MFALPRSAESTSGPVWLLLGAVVLLEGVGLVEVVGNYLSFPVLSPVTMAGLATLLVLLLALLRLVAFPSSRGMLTIHLLLGSLAWGFVFYAPAVLIGAFDVALVAFAGATANGLGTLVTRLYARQNSSRRWWLALSFGGLLGALLLIRMSIGSREWQLALSFVGLGLHTSFLTQLIPTGRVFLWCALSGIISALVVPGQMLVASGRLRDFQPLWLYAGGSLAGAVAGVCLALVARAAAAGQPRKRTRRQGPLARRTTPTLEAWLRKQGAWRSTPTSFGRWLDEVDRGKALGPLIAALDLDAIDDRLAAAEVLGMLGAQAEKAVPKILTLIGNDPAVGDRAADALANIGPAAVDGLSEALADPNPIVRIAAANALRQLGPAAARASDQLVTALGDSSPDVRRRAAAALGRCGTNRPSITDALSRLLDDPHWLVRLATQKSLRDLAVKQSGESL